MTSRLPKNAPGANPLLALTNDAHVEKASRAVFGNIFNEPDRSVSIALAITDILPDPAQPRRAVPSQARLAWDGKANAGSIQTMLEAWVDLAARELGEPLPIYVATEPPANYQRIEVDEASTPISFKLLKLADMANDIFDRGLNDPISVNALENGGYRIEYGERRWLAHWWLLLATNDLKWTKINAFVRDEFSVWRQASENGARQQLNAIGLARQLARLLMDIHKGVAFKSYEDTIRDGESDRDFYAQVANGDKLRIPRGMGDKISAAMGLPNTTQLRQYRALLRLPDDIWIQGDDQSWTEGALRPYTVTTVTGSGDKPPRKKPRQMNRNEEEFNANVRGMLASLRFDEKVNVKVVESVEGFCKWVRDENKIFTPETKR